MMRMAIRVADHAFQSGFCRRIVPLHDGGVVAVPPVAGGARCGPRASACNGIGRGAGLLPRGTTPASPVVV